MRSTEIAYKELVGFEVLHERCVVDDDALKKKSLAHLVGALHLLEQLPPLVRNEEVILAFDHATNLSADFVENVEESRLRFHDDL